MAKTEYDLLSPAFRADPYPTYAAMRCEAPVYPLPMPDAPTLWTRGTQWNVTRYAPELDLDIRTSNSLCCGA